MFPLYGIETYGPVVDTLMIIISGVVLHKYTVWSVDVWISAFLIESIVFNL